MAMEMPTKSTPTMHSAQSSFLLSDVQSEVFFSIWTFTAIQVQ